MGSVDAALDEVAGYRRFSMLTFTILSITMMLTLACQGLNIVFVGFESPHHCKLPEGQLVNESIPPDRYGMPKKCEMYANNTKNDTVSCTEGWTYDRVYDEHTIITEWDLVCEHNYLAGLSHTIYQVGAVCGELVFARMIDVVGRKWVGIVGHGVVIILGVALAYMPNFVSFIILRTIIAFFVPMVPLAGATLIMELCGTKERVFYATILEFGWSLVYFYVVMIAYFIREWRTLQLVLSLSSLIGLFAILVPESPYWLVINDRVEEAEVIVQKIARLNKVKVKGQLLSGTKEELLGDANGNADKKDMDKDVDGEDEWSRKYKGPGEETLRDLFTDPLLLRFLLISMGQWFVSSLVYYMCILGSYVFGGNIYLNFTLGGIVELPAFLAAYFIAKQCRRAPTGILYLITGALLIALGFTPSATASGIDLTPLIIVELLLLRVSSVIPWCIIILYVKELFPTNLRATGFGLSSVVGRIGSMAVPFILLVVSNTNLTWIVNLVIGIFSFLVGIATLLLLPETKDWPLPQSVADVHRYTERKVHHPIKEDEVAEAEAAF